MQRGHTSDHSGITRPHFGQRRCFRYDRTSLCDVFSSALSSKGFFLRISVSISEGTRANLDVKDLENRATSIPRSSVRTFSVLLPNMSCISTEATSSNGTWITRGAPAPSGLKLSNRSSVATNHPVPYSPSKVISVETDTRIFSSAPIRPFSAFRISTGISSTNSFVSCAPSKIMGCSFISLPKFKNCRKFKDGLYFPPLRQFLKFLKFLKCSFCFYAQLLKVHRTEIVQVPDIVKIRVPHHITLPLRIQKRAERLDQGINGLLPVQIVL